MSNKSLTAVEKSILNKLLDAYERKQENSNRRVIIKAEKFELYDLENVDMKHLFIQSVQSLHKREYVKFTWVKFEMGNLLNQIILVEKAVPEICLRLQRVGKSEKTDIFINELKAYKENIVTDWVSRFLADEENYISRKNNWSAIWPKDKGHRKEFVKLLSTLEVCENMPLRYLSVRLFGDSKKIENEYKAKIVSVAKKYIPLSLDDEDILEYLGVELNPRDILFCGNLEYQLKGVHLSTAGYIYGTSINQLTIKYMNKPIVHHSKVLTIENKATYYEYLKVKRDDELVIYLGGFFGRATREFLMKLKTNKKLIFEHWSDIDLGGFRIYKYLMNLLENRVKPVGMDVSIYQKYTKKSNNIDKLPDTHLNEIEAMMSLSEMVMLKEVMSKVLIKKKRLEQERIDVKMVSNRK